MYWDQVQFDALEKRVTAVEEQSKSFEKRIALLESIFKKIAEQDMRLDTLEFNSNLPVRPGISEKLLTLEYKLEHIHDFLTQSEIPNEQA